MQEKPKQNDEACGEDTKKDGVWEADQRERSYYYDDAHGYEKFVDTDDDADDDELTDQSPAG